LQRTRRGGDPLPPPARSSTTISINRNSSPSTIYNEADAKLRAAVKRDDLNKLLAQFHKLGNVTAATRPGTIGLVVWLKSEEGLRLLNYDIKSAAKDGSHLQ